MDSMFVARIPDSGGITNMGEYAVNALTLAFPVQMLIVAFGVGAGVFQALGRGLDSLIISLLRLCVVVLPPAWWFAKLENNMADEGVNRSPSTHFLLYLNMSYRWRV